MVICFDFGLFPFFSVWFACLLGVCRGKKERKEKREGNTRCWGYSLGLVRSLIGVDWKGGERGRESDR